LLPSVLVRLRELCGKAADAAQSWGNGTEKDAALDRKKLLSTCNGAVNVEQWAVNKAVRYNEWTNFWTEGFRAGRCGLSRASWVLPLRCL
jgi:hypothetical protein